MERGHNVCASMRGHGGFPETTTFTIVALDPSLTLAVPVLQTIQKSDVWQKKVSENTKSFGLQTTRLQLVITARRYGASERVMCLQVSTVKTSKTQNTKMFWVYMLVIPIPPEKGRVFGEVGIYLGVLPRTPQKITCCTL